MLNLPEETGDLLHASPLIDWTERGGIHPGPIFFLDDSLTQIFSAAKGGFYGTRTFAAWNGGTPFKYNARIEATWLDIALSYYTIPKREP